MAIQYPIDPAFRKRVIRLQYIGLLLVLPKLIEMLVRVHFNGSALHTLKPYFITGNSPDRQIPSQSWWLLLTVECIAIVSFMAFLLVVLRILVIVRRSDAEHSHSN